MGRVFADAAYYTALLLPGDDLHSIALGTGRELRTTEIVTSDPVLVEVFAHMSGLGPVARSRAVSLLDELRADPRVRIMRQTPHLFDAGVELYRQRKDKAYSLTDCMSMIVCREGRITGVLTHDRHFQQEGLAILL
ncbi:MAG: type II toxin-antitoxin system VapC family toxin [Chloroflexota bacterium]|nr:type II toxin-antitoxin system VapC family toxin [Chloroflexota bacterium]